MQESRAANQETFMSSNKYYSEIKTLNTKDTDLSSKRTSSTTFYRCFGPFRMDLKTSL